MGLTLVMYGQDRHRMLSQSVLTDCTFTVKMAVTGKLKKNAYYVRSGVSVDNLYLVGNNIFGSQRLKLVNFWNIFQRPYVRETMHSALIL